MLIHKIKCGRFSFNDKSLSLRPLSLYICVLVSMHRPDLINYVRHCIWSIDRSNFEVSNGSRPLKEVKEHSFLLVLRHRRGLIMKSTTSV